ncbi:MAG: hypothetical protein RIR26_2084 [Pseudomonadota bacterium]|jgi:hypothetical protein
MTCSSETLLPRRLQAFTLFGFCATALLLVFGGCVQKEFSAKSDSGIQEAGHSGRNGGFRILPAMAARDPSRPRVIYRCNDVPCGEAFQPSNEERDLFFPCDLALKSNPEGKLPPYLRLVTHSETRTFVIKTDHQQACASARPFDEVVAQGEAKEASAPALGFTEGCRQWSSNLESCRANAAQGCRWVVHPSGRSEGGQQGSCVGLYRSNLLPNGTEKVQSLRSSGQPTQWMPLERYR